MMDWMSGWSWRTARWIAASLVAPVKSHGLEGNAVGDATTSESMQPPAWVERQGRVGASRFRAANDAASRLVNVSLGTTGDCGQGHCQYCTAGRTNDAVNIICRAGTPP